MRNGLLGSIIKDGYNIIMITRYVNNMTMQIMTNGNSISVTKRYGKNLAF